jgi:hypothetical protein
MAQTYQQMLNQAITKGNVADAQTWFDTSYQDLSSKSTLSVINKGDERLTKALSIGKMYLFHYDPKYKETLPLYDRFPLIFPFQNVEGGFMGINFHYLPYGQRAALLDNLMVLANNKTFTDKMRLNMSYRLLSAAARTVSFKECVKKYLNSHVRSRFFYIKPDEWSKALMLPLDDFVYKKKK